MPNPMPMDRPAEPDTLSVSEFARRFCVSEQTVRRCLKARQIYAVKVGCQWRIPMVELRRLLTGNAVGTAA